MQSINFGNYLFNIFSFLPLVLIPKCSDLEYVHIISCVDTPPASPPAAYGIFAPPSAPRRQSTYRQKYIKNYKNT